VALSQSSRTRLLDRASTLAVRSIRATRSRGSDTLIFTRRDCIPRSYHSSYRGEYAAVVVRMKDEAEIPPSIAGGMIRRKAKTKMLAP
jgi:hypothetical protein